LDLTRATLAAALKYPWRRGENPEKANKWASPARRIFPL
jgi:dGTP triphosphohydrolase